MNQVKAKKTYSIHAFILDRNPEIFLREEEFQNLKQAKICLDSAFALEENYDLLLHNYRELEIEAITASVTEMTTNNYEYKDFFEIRTALNRRVLNLLSATRMYLDQYPQILHRIGVDSKDAKQVCSQAYDNFFEYRFMEALRNHVQHEGLAVHGVTMGARRLPSEDQQSLQYSVTPYASKSALENSDFKKKVLNESPEKIALLPAVRVYIGGIGSVHKKIREAIAPLTQSARCQFEGAISRHEAEAGKKYLGLAAVAKEDAVVEKIPIFLDWDDVRQKLLKRNYPIENLANRFVTSRAEDFSLR